MRHPDFKCVKCGGLDFTEDELNNVVLCDDCNAPYIVAHSHHFKVSDTEIKELLDESR